MPKDQTTSIQEFLMIQKHKETSVDKQEIPSLRGRCNYNERLWGHDLRAQESLILALMRSFQTFIKERRSRALTIQIQATCNYFCFQGGRIKAWMKFHTVYISHFLWAYKPYREPPHKCFPPTTGWCMVNKVNPSPWIKGTALLSYSIWAGHLFFIFKKLRCLYCFCPPL